MKENVERCGGTAVMVQDRWGDPVDPEKVADAIKRNPDAKVLAFVHAETSTGVRSDAQQLLRIAAHTRGGFGMYEGEHLGVWITLYRISNFFGINRVTPPVLHHHGSPPAALNVFLHSPTKDAVLTNKGPCLSKRRLWWANEGKR